jgi:hypothetical protein
MAIGSTLFILRFSLPLRSVRPLLYTPNPLSFYHPGATGFDGFDEGIAACPGPGPWLNHLE